MTVTWGDEGFLEAWSEAWSCGDPSRLLPLYAPDAHYRDDGSQLDFHGHDEIAGFYRFMLVFAPDSDIRFHEAHGDTSGFGARWTWSGTAKKTLKVLDEYFPVNGGRFSAEGVAWCQVGPDGLIRSHVDYYDMHAVIRAISV